jgi:hypothetical protein
MKQCKKALILAGMAMLAAAPVWAGGGRQISGQSNPPQTDQRQAQNAIPRRFWDRPRWNGSVLVQTRTHFSAYSQTPLKTLR